MNSLLQSLYAPRFVISGRNAVSYYGLCSFDLNVEFLESDKLANLNLDLDHIIYVPQSPPNEVITAKNGVKYASLNKAIVDYLREPYDDSAIEEIFNSMTQEEYDSFKDYLEREELQDVRKQYAEFIEE